MSDVFTAADIVDNPLIIGDTPIKREEGDIYFSYENLKRLERWLNRSDDLWKELDRLAQIVKQLSDAVIRLEKQCQYLAGGSKYDEVIQHMRDKVGKK